MLAGSVLRSDGVHGCGFVAPGDGGNRVVLHALVLDRNPGAPTPGGSGRASGDAG